MLRVLHFSDVHVQEPVLAGPLAGLLGKRAVAALNLWLVRGRLFAEARHKLAALAECAQELGVHAALCTGDYTALGTVDEHSEARRAIAPFTALPLGLCTVPGNHDLYLPDTLADHRFEQAFGDLLGSDLPELAGDGPFPFVRLLGEHLAVLGVNSARPNPNPFVSSGRIPDAQLSALARALADARLAGRHKLVMTHYGVLREDGRPDTPRHGLENAAELVAVCREAGALLVHGHLHHTYCHVGRPQYPAMFCAGSATQRGRESFWLYEVDAAGLRARRGAYEGGRYRLANEPAVELGRA
jgi:3',5'-cyclic AMP phosphodiesterase CpdA